MKYRFGTHGTDYWTTEADSLKVAIRKFRVGVLFPHAYTTGRIPSEVLGARGYNETIYRSSKPGSMIEIHAGDQLVGQIPPEGTEAAYDPAIINRLPQATPAASTSTALATCANREIIPVERALVEDKMLELNRQMGELERQRLELNQQVQQMRTELERRMEQIWMIELFLGSHEQVTLLRDGQPAPANTRISVHQRVLCMDEEIAVHTWKKDPANFEGFDFESLEDFDQWLLADPAHLNSILPEPKGIAALRVRRYKKQREENSLTDIFVNVDKEQKDRKVYLLVRNGEQLYRLWVDVDCWPRFFPRLDEWDWIGNRDRPHEWDVKDAEKQMKRYFAGILVVQGLIERSDLFAPLPYGEKLDVFKPESFERHFNCIRNDEGNLALGTGDELERITWGTYSKWLREQLAPGVRVLWSPSGHQFFNCDEMYERTGVRTVSTAPDKNDPYTLGEKHGSRFSFLYLPKEDRWTPDGGFEPRTKRVRWECWSDEVWAIEFMSWRVLEHLLTSRAERQHYSRYFGLLGKWYLLKKTESEQERPFIDLVLQQCGVNPRLNDAATEAERARAERLLRWWKMKTKTHRTLSTDEAKALRMITKAMKAGNDEENDPERLLFQRNF